MVAYTGNNIVTFNILVDNDGLLHINSNWFFDKHRDAVFASDLLLLTVSKRRRTNIDGVQILPVEHLFVIGISGTTIFLGTASGAIL